MNRSKYHEEKPIYLRIAEIIGNDIMHEYEHGMLLPSELILAQRFGVNRHTVRRAVDELIIAGLVERRHGTGVIVLDAAIDYRLGSRARFTENLSKLGHETGTKIVRKQLMSACGGIARRLNLPDGDEVIWIETARYVDDRPFCLISHFLARARCSLVWEDYKEGSLHRFVAEAHGIELVRTESTISTMLPRSEDARLLGIGRHQPILRVKTTNCERKTLLPIEYGLTRFRGDRVQLSIDFPA